jgi:adenylyl-sulfate kinase
LDGDEVRKNLSHGLGFSRDDRDRNVRRIGYVARMIARSGSCAITAAISPYRALREEIRSKTENFFEVYCECPLDVLTERDPKGLYKRALAGEIKNFTGVDDPYEAPADPEVHVRTDLLSVEQALEVILNALEKKGLLEPTGAGHTALPEPFGGEVFQARQASADELSGVEARLEVSSELAEEIGAVASGYFSPVAGFMTQREAVKVQKNQALERGTPWWDRPFVLPLSDAEVAEGQRAVLQRNGRQIGIVKIEQIWERDGSRFAAGEIEAVASGAAARPTSREFRAEMKSLGAVWVGSLFADTKPAESALMQVKTALGLCDAVVVAVPAAECEAWSQSLASRQIKAHVIGLPGSFPFESERARLVVQKSLGASGNHLLSS